MVLPVKSKCHQLELNKLKHEIVAIRTTQESQGSVLEAATDLSTLTLVTGSEADVLGKVLLRGAPD